MVDGGFWFLHGGALLGRYYAALVSGWMCKWFGISARLLNWVWRWGDLFSEEDTQLAEAASNRAREESLKQGIAVTYRDHATGLEVLQEPDGRRFEIRFIAGAPRGHNFEVLRELASNAG